MKLVGNQHANGRCPMKRGQVDTKKKGKQQFSVTLIAISRHYPDVLRRVSKTRPTAFGSNLSTPSDNVTFLQVTGAFGRGNFPHSHVNSPPPPHPPGRTYLQPKQHYFTSNATCYTLHATRNGLNTERKAKFPRNHHDHAPDFEVCHPRCVYMN